MLMKVTDANSVLVFDPRGRVEASDTPIAARPTSLDGLRLAILDNSKWNANKILRGSAAALQKAVTFRAVNYYVKESFSKDAAPELIEEIAANNDIVLTAIGDCGSCCSCCVRDAIALEKKRRSIGRDHYNRIRPRDRTHPPRDRHAGPTSSGDRPPREFDHAARGGLPRLAGRRAGARGLAGPGMT